MLEILIALTISPTPSLFVAKRETWENFEETSGVLQHKSGNVSETRRDRRKVTMEGL